MKSKVMKGKVMKGKAMKGHAMEATETTPVLYVLKRFPRLSETFVLREILALEARGVRVLIDALLEPEDEPRHDDLALLGAEVRYVPRRPRLRHRAVLAAHARVFVHAPATWTRLALRARRGGEWRRFLQAGLAADRVEREGVGHVHAHFATAAACVARDAAALSGAHVSVTAHAKDIFHVDNADVLPQRLAGVDTVVTVSEYNVDHLRSVLGERDVRYIPNGVALPEPTTPRSDAPVLCVSRLVPKKGIDTLIDAAAIVAATGRPSFELDVIGGGSLADELREQVARLDLAGNVRFLGAQTSTFVDTAYRNCSMVVLPCRIDASGDRDGLPTVLVEAMARGLPVISTDVVGIPELVRHEETGLLVPPDDPAALARAITRLLDDPAFAARLGAAARVHVADRYDPSRSTTALLDVFAGAH